MLRRRGRQWCLLVHVAVLAPGVPLLSGASSADDSAASLAPEVRLVRRETRSSGSEGDLEADQRLAADLVAKDSRDLRALQATDLGDVYSLEARSDPAKLADTNSKKLDDARRLGNLFDEKRPSSTDDVQRRLEAIKKAEADKLAEETAAQQEKAKQADDERLAAAMAEAKRKAREEAASKAMENVLKKVNEVKLATEKADLLRKAKEDATKVAEEKWFAAERAEADRKTKQAHVKTALADVAAKVDETRLAMEGAEAERKSGEEQEVPWKAEMKQLAKQAAESHINNLS